MKFTRLINVCILFFSGHIEYRPPGACAEAETETSYSRSLSELQTLRRYNAVTIETCRQQCKYRQRCHGALYSRRQGRCTLLSSHFREPVVLPDKGNVFITGFDKQRNNDPLCGAIACTYKETCNEDFGSGICKVTECGQPPTFYKDYKGNMFEVNRTISFPDSNLTMTCNADGSWQPNTDSVIFDCSNVTGPSGVYNLSYYSIYCDMDTDGGNWLVFVRRKDGSEYFQRGWTAYELGFGNLTGEFWLGLELMHTILKSGDYELRADLEDSNGNTAYAKYNTMTLSSYEDRYRLFLSGYSGNAGDSMDWANGQMFSTFDYDNDAWGNINCGAFYTCAWWLNRCYRACLTGRYLRPAGGYTGKTGHYVLWWHWRQYSDCLKTAEMKIRRK